MMGFRAGVLAAGSIAAGATGVVYTASQINIYNNDANMTATYAKLTDGSGSTGGGTASNSLSWIQATFSAPVRVSSVLVGGGSIPGWGAVAPYLNNALIRYSSDGANWTTIATISGVTDSGTSQFKAFTFSPITARYWRLEKSSWLSTTELVFTG